MLIFVAKIALRPLQCDYMHIGSTLFPLYALQTLQRNDIIYARYRDGKLHIIIIYI